MHLLVRMRAGVCVCVCVCVYIHMCTYLCMCLYIIRSHRAFACVHKMVLVAIQYVQIFIVCSVCIGTLVVCKVIP